MWDYCVCAANLLGVAILSLYATLNVGGASLQDCGGGIRAASGDVKVSGSLSHGVQGVAFSQSSGAAVLSECAFLADAPDSLGDSDGMELTSSANVTLGKTLLSGMQTAGLLVAGATVTGDGVRISGNALGLVREGKNQDTWVRSLIFDNAGGDIRDPGTVAPAGLPGSVHVPDGSDAP